MFKIHIFIDKNSIFRRKPKKFQIVATWKVGKFGLFAKFKQNLSLENQALILFEDVCKTPITKCNDVLIQFQGKNRIKLQFRGYL